MSTLAPVDWALLAVLALSILIGIWRGLAFELMSLAGWIVAYLAAVAFAPKLSPMLLIGDPGSALNHAAAIVAVFLLALVLWTLLARLVRMAIAATPLTIPDRFLGAAFGLVRGLVLLIVVATVVALTPASQSPAWRQSVGVQWLGVALAGLRAVLPGSIEPVLPARVSADAPRGQ